MLRISRMQLNQTRFLHVKNPLDNIWKTIKSPSTTKVLFKADPSKIKPKIKVEKPPTAPSREIKLGPRFNDLNIQMLSKTLFDQVFKNCGKANIYDDNLIQICKQTLAKNGMISKDTDYITDVDLELPELCGNNLVEHFEIIGEAQAKPYRDLVMSLCIPKLPKKPDMWLLQEGWTRFEPNKPPEKVNYPLENGVIFDIEVCMSAGKAPTLATAVTTEAWYSWVSPTLVRGFSKPMTNHQYNQDCLIPFESVADESGINLSEEKLIPKVIIGHNVSYDRARIKEQYWLERTGTRFVDTMSLHVCISGITSYQRAMLKSKNENYEDDVWKALSSLNSLSEVHKLYTGRSLAKETRSIFVTGTLTDIQNEFQNVMDYCSNDVVATWDVLKCMFPTFLERFPHPVTFAGMLELGTAYLPINSNWSRYIEDSEQTYEDLSTEGRILLGQRADHACHLMHGEKFRDDLWMWDQDWDVKQFKMNKTHKKVKKNDLIEVRNKIHKDDEEDLDPLDIKFQYLDDMKSALPANKAMLPGYPAWYKKLCVMPGKGENWTPGPHLISTSMQITPKLLSLTWEGYPLHFIRGLGWGLLVPFSADIEGKQIPLERLLIKCPLLTSKANVTQFIGDINQQVQDNLAKKDYYKSIKKIDKSDGLYKGSGIWCDTILEGCVFFFKLPHKDGASFRVGNPLAKDFLNKFSENVLAGDTENAEQVLAIARKLSYWRNNKDRINEQMVVWLDDVNLPEQLKGGNFGAILPQVVVCGTLTRRAMEPTWMTASNAHVERIGSELRAMIQAPPGYNLVGADVDSQELWIASVIGDSSYAKMHGATPLGWMTLSGRKSDGTDMHSVTAKAVGISRDHAKVINYARIYGAGQNFAERLLKQFNPSMSETEARSKSLKMFALTKGKRIYQLRPQFLLDFVDQPYTKWSAFELAKLHGKTVNEMFYKPQWIGGTESAMFNQLEKIAGDVSPVTPFLHGRLSRALEPLNLQDERFLPTRVNWVVQSGAVDFLHLMLVLMRWILKERARFCLSFHDEVRYLVPEKHKYQAALAMHVTNLLTRAFCSMKLGIYDLPNSIAFFSSVEVDTVLRKESKHDCKTPSNPHGLEKGYGIKHGESLDIYEAIKKAKGNHKDWFKN